MISLALAHQFFLVNRGEHDFGDYLSFVNSPGATELHDDLVDRMWDTLLWIPTLNPSTNARSAGLHRWGPTVITYDGAPQAAAIFGGWAQILAAGPTSLQLRGSWTWTDGTASNAGRYESLQFPRDEVVQTLRRLESFAIAVSQANGELYVLHLGV